MLILVGGKVPFIGDHLANSSLHGLHQIFRQFHRKTPPLSFDAPLQIYQIFWVLLRHLDLQKTPHVFNGFKSGLWAGQGRRSTPFSSLHFLASLLVCFGSLSSCSTQLSSGSVNHSIAEGIRAFLYIWTKSWALRFWVKRKREPKPLEEKQPQA